MLSTGGRGSGVLPGLALYTLAAVATVEAWVWDAADGGETHPTPATEAPQCRLPGCHGALLASPTLRCTTGGKAVPAKLLWLGSARLCLLWQRCLGYALSELALRAGAPFSHFPCYSTEHHMYIFASLTPCRAAKFRVPPFTKAGLHTINSL